MGTIKQAMTFRILGLIGQKRAVALFFHLQYDVPSVVISPMLFSIT